MPQFQMEAMKTDLFNNALRRRGDISIWFTQDAIDQWRPAKTGGRGRAQEYSDHAIDTAMLIRQVFKLALRQTEELMTSIARVMGAAISIPDFSCIASTRFKSCHPTPQGGSSVFAR